MLTAAFFEEFKELKPGHFFQYQYKETVQDLRYFSDLRKKRLESPYSKEIWKKNNFLNLTPRRQAATFLL